MVATTAPRFSPVITEGLPFNNIAAAEFSTTASYRVGVSQERLFEPQYLLSFVTRLSSVFLHSSCVAALEDSSTDVTVLSHDFYTCERRRMCRKESLHLPYGSPCGDAFSTLAHGTGSLSNQDQTRLCFPTRVR